MTAGQSVFTTAPLDACKEKTGVGGVDERGCCMQEMVCDVVPSDDRELDLHNPPGKKVVAEEAEPQDCAVGEGLMLRACLESVGCATLRPALRPRVRGELIGCATLTSTSTGTQHAPLAPSGGSKGGPISPMSLMVTAQPLCVTRPPAKSISSRRGVKGNDAGVLCVAND